VEGWQMMRTQYRESEDSLEQFYRYLVSPCKYAQGCRRGYRNHRQMFGVEILVDGMAFGATSGTWGNALTCATKAGTLKEMFTKSK
jgi:hypothetical protein